jgi:hypothetical protein
MEREKPTTEEAKFNARFPRPLFEALREVAREHERSINSELIWIVREYLERRKSREEK